MKFQVVLVLVALIVVTSAGRKHKKQKDDAGCKFDKGEWSGCDTNNQMKRTLTLREQRDGCPATKEQTRPCKDKKSKGCRYRPDGDWSECDSALNIRTRKVVLHKGGSQCEPEKMTEITCDKYLQVKQMEEEKKKGKERAIAMKAEKKAFKQLHKKLKHFHKMGCHFKEEKTQCNNDTQKVTLTFALETGSDSSCVMDPVEVSCALIEKYEKIKQAKMEKKERKKMEKKERKNKEKMERKEGRKNKKQKDKKDRKERRKHKNREGKCKYQRGGPWSDCDITTDTMKMTMTLKKGDPTKCPSSKMLSKKCKKPCKYATGKWGPCVHGITERVDRLKKNSQDICEPLRKLTKKCKGKKKIKKRKGDCIYGQGEWGVCDPQTKKRAKTKLLTSGSLLQCKSQKVVYRSCLRNDGKDRCFFGKWGDWSNCQNGVQKKQREVVQGGVECQKRAVRTKPCS